MIKRLFIIFLIAGIWFSISSFPAWAGEITILYTGDTHAMLYTCNCPKEPIGGLSRRATLIKQLRKENPDTLVLDSGGFFASGMMDEYSQNTQLDIQRTLASLKAMELMQYDALAIGDNEFNFGREFLEANIAKYKLNFLSANIKSAKALPYFIKEVGGVKIGIVAVSPVADPQKYGALRLLDPDSAVGWAISELKKQSVELIVVLSGLNDSDNQKLLQDVEGINIIISGFSMPKQGASDIQPYGSALVIRPSWQGRSLGKLSLVVKDGKILKYKTEQLPVSEKITQDPEVLAAIPHCFSDSDCKSKDQRGICRDPGTLNSQCKFSQPRKVSLLIIVPKACLTCNTDRPINLLKKYFPGLQVDYLFYPSRRADRLLKQHSITKLPVYLLGKEVSQEKEFAKLMQRLDKKGDFYLVDLRFVGFSYFLGRQRFKGKLDLFISLFEKDSQKLLKLMKQFHPTIHFLAKESKESKFDASRGGLEVEEYLRAVCVEKYNPRVFWDYLECRSGNIYSSWWDDCLPGQDIKQIKSCAQSQEGEKLLKENISLNKELGIMLGPTYLLDNQEIFSSQGVPAAEELKKLIKR
ncbi:hypothetical protein D4R78_00635 [bacterium]|nr:MAG: hypothetical protein D4R78_00635 [bacterium]